jgi:hypothetical protein
MSTDCTQPESSTAGHRPGRRRARAIVGAAVAALAVAGAYIAFATMHHPSDRQRLSAYVRGASGKEFPATDAGFSVTFPTWPHRMTKQLDVAGTQETMVMYESDLGGASFAAASVPYPAGRRSSLASVADATASGMGGQLVSSRYVDVAGTEGIEFVIRTPKNGYVKILVFRTSDTVYELMVGGPDPSPAGYDRFEASFTIGG